MENNLSNAEIETLSDMQWQLAMFKKQIEDGKERVQAIKDSIWIPRWKESEVESILPKAHIIEKGFFECTDFIINPTTMSIKRGKFLIDASDQLLNKNEKGPMKKGVRAINALRELKCNAHPNDLAKKLHVTIDKKMNKTLAPYLSAARRILKEIGSEYTISKVNGHESIELGKVLTKTSK